MAETRNWAIIRHSGKTENFPQIHCRDQTFWEVMDALYAHLQSGGSSYDGPKTLLLNGRAIDFGGVEIDTWNWRYQKDKQERLSAAAIAAREAALGMPLEEFLAGKD